MVHFPQKASADASSLVFGFDGDTINPGPPIIKSADYCPDNPALAFGDQDQIAVSFDLPLQIRLVWLGRPELSPEIEHARNVRRGGVPIDNAGHLFLLQ